MNRRIGCGKLSGANLEFNDLGGFIADFEGFGG